VIVSNPNTNNPVNLMLRNEGNELLASVQSLVGEYVFQNLYQGSYTLRVEYGTGDFEDLLVSVNTVGLSAPASFVASSTEVDLSEAIIEFNASGDESIEYTWDFGDGSGIITGTATPVHAYMAPGIYTVSLTIRKDGCSSFTSQTIKVTANSTGIDNKSSNRDGIIIFPNPASTHASLLINLGLQTSENLEVLLSDATGRVVFQKEFDNVRSGTVIPLQLENLANGLYQVTVKGKLYNQVSKLTIKK
jgi:PKD repeat protein